MKRRAASVELAAAFVAVAGVLNRTAVSATDREHLRAHYRAIERALHELREDEVDASGGFAARLKQAVKLAGGPEAVAKRLSVAASTLYTYFNGKQSPTVRLTCEIADLAGVSRRWLFIGTEPRA